MWFFDFLKASYNFANNIKFIFEKLDIDINNNHTIRWYDILVVHDSIANILNWISSCPSNLNIKILTDIKDFLWTYYINDFYKIKKMSNEEQRDYLINIFDKAQFDIISFTYSVMEYSTVKKWLWKNYFNSEDKKIVKKVFWF